MSIEVLRIFAGAYAEEKNVTITLELLNSNVNHKDYMADHSAWGVELMKRVNSPKVKLLYDLYHMQIMEGDLIRTIRENMRFIGHFHTGGNLGCDELDDTQEVNWHAVANAIADTGYTGFFSHELVLARTPPPSRAWSRVTRSARCSAASGRPVRSWDTHSRQRTAPLTTKQCRTQESMA